MKKHENDLVVFADGSSLGNPGVGGWGAILIYQKLNEVIELGGNKAHTTNNEMELTAVVSALGYALNSNAPLHIYTDSRYTIQGATEWIYRWSRNGWKTSEKEDVKNKALWQSLLELIETRGKNTIHFHHVHGHVGVPGNERVDDIARGLAEGSKVNLYRGKLSQYGIHDILTIPKDAEQKELYKGRKAGTAYSYIALIDGKVERFSNWADCEARVTGRSAKFRKALSLEHEKEIIKDWGVTE